MDIIMLPFMWIISLAKDSASHFNEIKETFNLRSKGEIHYFLGHDFRQKKNGSWATSAKISTCKAMSKVEQEMGDVPLAKTPDIAHDRP